MTTGRTHGYGAVATGEEAAGDGRPLWRDARSGGIAGEVAQVIDLVSFEAVPARSLEIAIPRAEPVVEPSGGRALVDAAVTRAVDILVALTLLTLLSPILLAIALAVVLTSDGPALFRQERYGRGGEVFTMLKFRSMAAGAADQAVELAGLEDPDRVDAPAFKSPDDPRVTPLGRVLRRASLDELPQLINVLVGDMALVGPRPLVHDEAQVLSPDAFELRHSVRPGLTGRWQVERVEDTTFVERMGMDLEYAATRSCLVDLRLLLRTPASIVRGAGCF